MRDVPLNTTTSFADNTPAICPVCRSSSIVTKTKSPDADTYWRCVDCGEVWNVARHMTDRPGVYRWR